jgi:hypothetical protein
MRHERFHVGWAEGMVGVEESGGRRGLRRGRRHSQKLGVKVRVHRQASPRDVRLFGGKRPYDTWQRVA